MIKLPESVKKVSVCLGWDTKGVDIDVDASIVTFDRHGRDELDAVYFGNKIAPGINHSGDNLTGEGDGDDETITVTLDDLPEDAQQLFVAITLYNPPGTTFKDVTNAYCRILDADTGKALARFDFGDTAKDHSGLVMARFLKHDDNGWHVEKLGKFAPGKDFRDLMPEMLQIRDAVDSKRRRTS